MFFSQQGSSAAEQTGAAEGPGEEEEGAGAQGPEGGARGAQEEERPGDRADEEAAEARTGAHAHTTHTHSHTHTHTCQALPRHCADPSSASL